MAAILADTLLVDVAADRKSWVAVGLCWLRLVAPSHRHVVNYPTHHQHVVNYPMHHSCFFLGLTV